MEWWTKFAHESKEFLAGGVGRLIYLSLLALLGWSQLRKRVFAKDYLTGDWEGVVPCSNGSNKSLYVLMSFSLASANMPKSLVHYEKNFGATKVLEGADRLFSIEFDKTTSQQERRWSMQKVRWKVGARFAQLYQMEMKTKGLVRDERVYDTILTVTWLDLIKCASCDIRIQVSENDGADQVYAGRIYRR